MSFTFVLLDDCHATAQAPSSRLYTDCLEVLACDSPAQWPQCLVAAAQAQQRLGLHAVLLADYEWGRALHKLPDAHEGPNAADAALQVARSAGALRIALFRTLQTMSAQEVDQWLAAQSAGAESAGTFGWRTALDEAQFTQRIADIHAAIARGETYQVNYTFACEGQAYGAPVALYQRLKARQPAPYGALIAYASGDWALSFSPELFVRVEGAHMQAQPMKGTVRVGDSPAQTAERAQWLKNDEKNRAENVMIVDLLRNDLGQVAETGSVQVRDLFDVQPHGQVLQMTTRIDAKLRPDAGLAQMLQALFPCGSITGAPKRQTMHLIEQLECHARGLYTGALGWLDSLQVVQAEAAAEGEAACGAQLAPIVRGSACLSVPIRTVFLQPQPPAAPAQPCLEGPACAPLDSGLYRARLPVGAGIVWNSQAAQEWQECALKSEFATRSPVGFELFETLHVRAGRRIANVAGHFARLQRSAAELGFVWDPVAAERALAHYAQGLSDGEHRLKLQLSAEGAVQFSSAPLTALPQGERVSLIVWPHLCRTPHALLRHKTTLRHDYDAALHAAMDVGAFDALFFNAQGFLTEGARSNVLVKLQGRWCTPRIEDGALPGTLRAQLMQDARWNVRECPITKEQLLQAQDLAVCNALRGVLMAQIAG